MAYFPDLSPYNYHRSGVDDATLNVGWLDRAHEFSQGDVPEPFLERLWAFCRFPVVIMRGYHVCHFCDMLWNEVPTISFRGEVLKVGFAEIRVFGKGNKVYAAPNLIFHYVVEHQYLPPKEFIKAVLESPLPDSREYQERASKYDWGQGSVLSRGSR